MKRSAAFADRHSFNSPQMDLTEILEPYEDLLEITVLGRECRVPEKNTILRCLQFLDPENISDAELCWNGECLDCMVELAASNGATKRVIACRTLAENGMEIIGLGPVIEICITGSENES